MPENLGMKATIFLLSAVFLVGCASTTRHPSSSYKRRFFCRDLGHPDTTVYLVDDDHVRTRERSGGGLDYLIDEKSAHKVAGEMARVYVNQGRSVGLQEHMISGEHGGGQVEFVDGMTRVVGCSEED